MGRHTAYNSRSRRGYTLTEIAIVLGIIGILTAAIWAAAGVARYHVELNQGVDEIGTIVGNMRALYSGQNASAVVTTAASAALEQQFISQGVFPSNMACGTFSCHPWDTSAANGSAQLSLQASGANPAAFILEFQNLPVEVCTDLLVKNSLPGSDTGLQQIQVNGVSVGQASANTLPLTPTAAAASCPAGAATYKIDWYYNLGS